MNLKKLFMFEIAAVVIIVFVVVVFIEVTPYLTSSQQTGQIGVYNQKVFAQKTVLLQQGQFVGSQFNYTTYDPAILVVDLKFQDWQKSGYISLYCNGFLVVTIEATPKNRDVQLTTVTFSGYDLVNPPIQKIGNSQAFTYGNEISFASPQQSGYEGTFSYTISIRGSR